MTATNVAADIGMPYRIVWETPQSIWTQFSGTVTFAETVAATNALYADPRSDEVLHAYWDFSGIDGFAVATGDVELMASTDEVASRYLGRMKAAFIVRDPELAVLTQRYIALMQEFGSRWENRIFASMEEARTWASDRHAVD